MKKTFLSLFFIIILVYMPISSITAYSETARILNDVLFQYDVLFDKKNFFLITRNFKHSAREKIFHTIIAQERETRIEMEIIRPLSKVEATNFSRSKYIIVKSLYEPQIIPYSGALTHTTDCPESNKPTEIMTEVMGESVRVLLVNATERYVLGVWEESLVKQKAAFTILYDPKKSVLYQIMIFQPVESFNQNEALNILKSLKPIKKPKN